MSRLFHFVKIIGIVITLIGVAFIASTSAGIDSIGGAPTHIASTVTSNTIQHLLVVVTGLYLLAGVFTIGVLTAVDVIIAVRLGLEGQIYLYRVVVMRHLARRRIGRSAFQSYHNGSSRARVMRSVT